MSDEHRNDDDPRHAERVEALRLMRLDADQLERDGALVDAATLRVFAAAYEQYTA